jgi:hypothetical protein
MSRHGLGFTGPTPCEAALARGLADALEALRAEANRQCRYCEQDEPIADPKVVDELRRGFAFNDDSLQHVVGEFAWVGCAASAARQVLAVTEELRGVVAG